MSKCNPVWMITMLYLLIYNASKKRPLHHGLHKLRKIDCKIGQDHIFSPVT